MKVLFTIHGFPPHELGGSEIYSFSLARALKKQGLEVVVFARAVNFKTHSYSLNEEEVEGIRVIRVVNNLTDVHSFTDHFINKRVRDIFVSVLLKEKPDLVHFQHLIFLSGDLPSVARFYNVPNVLMLHDYWYFCMRVNLFKPNHTRCKGPNEGLNCLECFHNVTPAHLHVPASKFIDLVYGSETLTSFFKKIIPKRLKAPIKSVIFREQTAPPSNDSPLDVSRLHEFSFRAAFFKKQLSNCDYIISPSRHLQKRYAEQGFDNVNFIPLGIDPLHFITKKFSKEVLRFGFVGNISPTKGFAVLLRELKLLKAWGNMEMHIFGQVYEENYFKEEFSAIPSDCINRIKFHGRFERNTESLEKVYGNMDVLIFPSVCEENSPLVVREALMTGTPVIASNLGGIPESVVDGINGLLFDPDRKGDLAEKISRVIGSHELLPKLAKGAEESIVLNTTDHAQKIAELYSTFLPKAFLSKDKK